MGLLIAAPLSVNAQAEISEIMYDLPGTDAGREWVEVHNTGSAALDLSEWKLLENETHHALTHVSGASAISAGSYAIVADNAAAFLTDHPGYSGTLIDSAFSLSNTGETLTLKQGDTVVDSVSYTATAGGAGDGMSLQLRGGSWVAESPSPGGSQVGGAPVDAQEQERAVNEAVQDSSDREVPEQESESGGSAEPLLRPTGITVSAGGDRVVMMRASQFFEATVRDSHGSEMEHARVLWNFGNGAVVEGEKVFYQYNHPGTYVVSVKASSPDERLTARTRFTVKAEAGHVEIAAVMPSGVRIANRGVREVNLSHWSLRSGEESFLFPEDTILLPGAAVTFHNNVTGFSAPDARSLALAYPNGMAAAVPSAKAPPAPSFAVAPSRAPVVVNRVSAVEPEVAVTPVQTADLRSPAAAALVAAPQPAQQPEDLIPWLLALFAVLVCGLIGLFVLRNKMTEDEASFRIVDDSEEDVEKSRT